MIEKGAVIFNAEGSCVNSVLGKQQYKQQIITLSIAWLNRLDDILNSEELQQLGVEEKDKIRELFDQGVKHKMKMNFVRQMSKTSGLLLLAPAHCQDLERQKNQKTSIGNFSMWNIPILPETPLKHMLKCM